ncbi:mucin-12-like [Planococcus citri]|uniref:mucin-12-like n=1 Tax=Planococcus citri TaxID=170843 RepID=UPI0031F90410
MLLEYPCAMQRKTHYWRREGDLYNYVIPVAIVFFIFTSIVSAAPTFENSLPQSHSSEIVEYFSEINGCYYNFQRYEEGDRIVTNEPCLNCTCHNRMLMCYLRVCPFTKAIGQDCTIEKKPDQCCPIITCPEVPVKLLTSSTTSSPAPITSTTEIGFRDNYGCTINNIFYGDGAQVPSDVNKPCELCYCIRNRTACVMQECTLHVEGCRPIFKPGVCCPVRYECDYDREYTSTFRPQTTGGLLKSTTSSPVVDCQYGNKYFSDGELIKTEKPCEHCYCMRGDIVCAVQDCGEPLRGKDCIPTTPPPNKCCPSSYACANETATIEDITKVSDIAGTTFIPSDGVFGSYDTTTFRYKNTPVTLSQEQVYERLGESEKKTPTTTSLPEKILTTLSSLFSKHPSEDIQLDDESVDANEHSSPQPSASSEPSKDDSAVTEKQDSNEDVKTTPAILAEDVTPGASLPKASQGVIISSTQYEPTTLASIKDNEDNITKEVFTKSPLDESHDNAAAATEITTEKIKYETTKLSEKYDTTKLPEKVDTVSEKLTTPRASSGVVVSDEAQDETTEKLAPVEAITTEKIGEEITTSPNLPYSKSPSDLNDSSSQKQPDESSSESIKFQSTTRQFDKNGVLTKDQETTKAPEESLQATTKVQTDNTEAPAPVEQQTETFNTLPPESTASLLQNITKIVNSVQSSQNNQPSYQVPVAETTRAPVANDGATTIVREDIPAATEKVAEISSSSSATTTSKDEVATVVPSVIPGEGSCLVDGITYPNTSVIESYNPCHSKCICLSSIPTCTLITCAPPPSNPNCMPIQMKPESCCPVYICNNEKDQPGQVPSSDSQIMPDEPEDANHLHHDDETTTIVNSYEISTKASEPIKPPASEIVTEKSKPENDIADNKPQNDAVESTPQNDIIDSKPQDDVVEHKPEPEVVESTPHSDPADHQPEHDDGFEHPPVLDDNVEHKPEIEPIESKPTPANEQAEDKPELTTIAVNDKIQNEVVTESQKVQEEHVTENNIKDNSIPNNETPKPEIVTTEKQSLNDKIDEAVTENIIADDHTTVKTSSIVEEISTESDNVPKPTTIKQIEEKFGSSSESPTTLAAIINENTEKPAQQDDNSVDHDSLPHHDEHHAPEDEPSYTTAGSQDIVTENPPDTKPASTSEKYNDAVSPSENDVPHHDQETTEVDKITTTEGNSVVQPIAVSTESKDEVQGSVTEITPTEAGVTAQVDEKIDVNPTTLPEKIAEVNPTTLAADKIEPVPTTLPPKVSDEQSDAAHDNTYPSSSAGTLDNSETSEEPVTTTESSVAGEPQVTTAGTYSSTSVNDEIINTEVPNEITTKLYETYSSTEAQPVLTGDNKHQEPESPATTISDDLSNEVNPSIDTTTAAQIINDKIATEGESTNVPDITSSKPAANEYTSELYSSPSPTTIKDVESDEVITEKESHASEPPAAAGTYNLQTTTAESEPAVAETTEPPIVGNEPYQPPSSSPSYVSESTSQHVEAEVHTETNVIVTSEPPSSEIVTTNPPPYDEVIKDHEEAVKPITILPEINDSPAVTVLPSKTTYSTLPPSFQTEPIPTDAPLEDHSLNTPSSHDVHEPIQQGADETTPSHDIQEPIPPNGADETVEKLGGPVTEHSPEPFVPENPSQEPINPPTPTKKQPSNELGQTDHHYTPQYVETSSEVTQAPIQHSTWTRKPIIDEETSEPNYYPPAPMYPTGGGDGGSEGPSEESEYEDGSAFGTGTCRYGGKIYVSAQQIPREDPCDFCFCFRSDIICLQQSCPPPIQGCRQETISGFCCPRYECPVASALALAYNASTTTSTTTTSTTTTAQPHFTLESYRSHARKVGCMIHGYFYKVGEDIAIASGPCLECICGSDGRMKCDPKSCSPEPFVRSFIGEAMSKR